MDAQVQNAIEIAWTPSAEPNLKAQAFEFLNQLRANPEASQICLSLFTRTPRLSQVVRHVALEIVNHAIQTHPSNTQALQHARDNLIDYVRRVYGQGEDQTPEDSSATIQNKLAQTLTFLFVALYDSSWQSFFDDLLHITISGPQKESSRSEATLFYLRVLGSVHDEIADQLVRSTAEQQKKYTELKDLIRARDVSKIANSWQEILSRWRQLELPVVDNCLKTISRWVSWTDISLVVNEVIIGQLFDIASQQELGQFPNNVAGVRDAAIDVFTEIIGKKMQPNEKIELVRVLKLDAVLGQLVSGPALHGARGTPDYDTDMAETVAKLVNNIVVDIVKVLEIPNIEAGLREETDRLLHLFLPYLLRFFSDEFDEVCSTVIPSLADMLTLFRKLSKQSGQLPRQYQPVVPPILNAIITKMRYDDTSSWGEDDEETDEAEFQELRKRLSVLQQIVAAVEEDLYLETVSGVVESVFTRFKNEGSQLNWRDLDLAMHEMFLLGELALKNGGLYQKKKPSSAASERLLVMMSAMVESDIGSFPHPAARLKYMEICVRYCSFFEQHQDYIPRVLEAFVRFVHSDHPKLRARSWTLFLRYVRHLRAHLGNVAETVVQAISDLLIIRAELIDDSNDEDNSSTQNSQSADVLFTSQLSLFEAVGCISSTSSVPPETQLVVAQSVVNPLSAGIGENLDAAVAGDERAILQIHHLIEALGILAQGFSGSMPGSTGTPVLGQVSEVFLRISETILTALSALKGSMTIRSAARFAFSRLVAVLGFKTLEQLPRWIDGFLAESSTKDEMANVLRQLGQVIHEFNTQIFNILDTLLTPLLQRIFASFSEPIRGTDDEIHLGELRREYLTFLLNILNNKLESVLVSPTNQPIFETLVSTIEHFAKDTGEHPDSKMATSVLTKMCLVWGGPNIASPMSNPKAPSPALPGFDRFMLSRFSALTWAIMTNPGFDPKEPSANRVLGEVSILQQTILLKTGQEYLTWLRDVELRGLGAQEATTNEYLNALTTTDSKGFKQFLVRFISHSRT